VHFSSLLTLFSTITVNKDYKLQHTFINETVVTTEEHNKGDWI